MNMHNGSTFVALLKACVKEKDFRKGSQIHACMSKVGFLERDATAGSALINMYAKCGALAQAHEVFDKLLVRNVVSWTALMVGLVQNGRPLEAVSHFKQMQVEGVSPNALTFSCILKACGSIQALEMGTEVHNEVIRQGLLENDIVVGNALILMYVTLNLLGEAGRVFDTLLVRDVVSWTTLVSGYAQDGQSEEVFNYYKWMQQEGASSNAVTFVCILQACSSSQDVCKGLEIHAHIVRHGLLEKNVIVGNALVDMYATCGLLASARNVFDSLVTRDIVSYSVIIAGYADHGHGEEALNCFEQMKLAGIKPDAITFVNILKACTIVGAVEKGLAIQTEILRHTSLEKDVVVGTALINMFAKCDMIAKSREVFDNLPVQNLVSWSALIAGYVEHGYAEEALGCFERMKLEGIWPNDVIFVCILKACSSMHAVDKGEEIHADIVREGWLSKHTALGNALVDMYANCGLLVKAQEVFDILTVQDVFSCSVLISGYVSQGYGEKAILLFEHMQSKGTRPNEITFISILKVYGSLGAVAKGLDSHATITRERLLEKHEVIGNALVDMYVKCGLLSMAQELFDKLLSQDVVVWNSLMTGYAWFGKVEIVFNLFSRMLREGIKTDMVTFTCLANACSHAGLVCEGQMYFMTIVLAFQMFPSVEHYTCMVDLFARAGQLNKVITIIKEMPYCASILMWHIVLSTCQKLGDKEFGRSAFNYAMQLNRKDISAYVCMSNIYSDAG